MKTRILFLFLISLFVLSSCTKETVSCQITSPREGSYFTQNAFIDVIVEASTTKGSIIQVQLMIDNESFKSVIDTPYTFVIPEYTFEPGLHYITAIAYNTNRVQETSSVLINITE